MLKILSKYFLFKKIKKLNLKEFGSQNINQKYNGIVLVEFNSFHVLHVIFSYVSNFFKHKYNLRMVAYYSHILLSYNLERDLRQKIKSFIGEKLNLGFFGIYKSFGITEFLFPEISKVIKKKGTIHYKKVIKKLNTKKDILEIRINQTPVGDLIYDSYLTRNKKQKPTINLNDDDFKNFLKDFIYLYFFWENYFEKNNIKAVLVSHSVYTMGIPYRIALKKKIQSLEIKENKLKKHRYQNPYHFSEALDYPKNFKKLSNKEKKRALNIAKQNLNLRFKGINFDLPYANKIAFNNEKLKKKLIKKKKFTILILTHDFIDAPHVVGKFAFEDMYEWVKYLSKLSKEKNNCKWLLKTHKKQGGKFESYQKFTENIVDKLIKDSNITKLNSDTSHNSIIKNGVNLVLTVFGTPAHEYAFKNITVLNASKMNSHVAYKFNHHINNTQEYKNFFNKLNKSKININKKKVLEFYYMHYIYNTKNWFFTDYNLMLKKLGNYHYQWTDKFYDYWLQKNVKKEFKYELYNKIEKFLKSKDLVFNVTHL